MINRIQRSFIVGDEWLYYKIYTGHKTSDIILTDIIKPVAEYLFDENIIEKWFFIRYADPEHHIRLRIRHFNKHQVNETIQQLFPQFRFFVDRDLIWKIQIDTYLRELERYGIHTMELSEKIFFHDSKMVVNFLDMIEGEEGEELRWLFSLRAIDSFLDSYQYPEDRKLSLLDQLKTNFGNEFGMSRPLKKQIDNKYRNKRGKIEEFMNFTALDMPDYAPILDILKSREEGIVDIAKKTIAFNESNSLPMPLDSLMTSYLHMFMNRLFKSKNRMHEMVCYDFLYRFYKSSLARTKKGKKQYQN